MRDLPLKTRCVCQARAPARRAPHPQAPSLESYLLMPALNPGGGGVLSLSISLSILPPPLCRGLPCASTLRSAPGPIGPTGSSHIRNGAKNEGGVAGVGGQCSEGGAENLRPSSQNVIKSWFTTMVSNSWDPLEKQKERKNTNSRI